jgi:hypothetical protein
MPATFGQVYAAKLHETEFLPLAFPHGVWEGEALVVMRWEWGQ